MNIIRSFHGHFASLTSGLFYWLMESVDDVLSDFRDQIIEKTTIFAITTCVGDELDLWGIDLDLPRLTSESDTDYRARLKLALQGKGVTRGGIEKMVNDFLGYLLFDDCTIEEWFEVDDLPNGWFRINIDRPAKAGMWLSHSFVDYVAETRNSKECHLAESDFTITKMRIPDIRKILNRWKASGIQYLINVGGKNV